MAHGENFDMVPVASTNLDSVGYDDKLRRLRVMFRNGRTYEYAGVSPEEHAALMESDSKGAAFYHLIRRKYEGKLITS